MSLMRRRLGIALAALLGCNTKINDDPVTVAVTVLASLNTLADQGDDTSSTASISSDGRYVAFRSLSTNFASPATTSGRSHVYVRDRLSRTTVMVSVNTTGGEGNGDSLFPSISGDGRYVAFQSLATDLVPGFVDGNGPAGADIYLRDLLLGTTTLLSVTSAGLPGANGSSEDPAISGNGAFVSFKSAATNLVAGFTDGNAGGFDVYRRDVAGGTTLLLSINAAGTASGNGSSDNPSISFDGLRIVFESAASNLNADDADATRDIHMRDLTGVPVTVLISRASGVAGVKGNGQSQNASISGNGLVIAFRSFSTNLDSHDTTGLADVLVRDLGESPPTTHLTTAHTSGAQAGQDCDLPAVSFDGRFIVYQSGSASLVDGDTNGAQDVFLRDRVRDITTRQSVATFGAQGETGPSLRPAISSDGRFIAFESTSADLVEVDVNGRADILLRGPLY